MLEYSKPQKGTKSTTSLTSARVIFVLLCG
jgi:hypothetical protein